MNHRNSFSISRIFNAEPQVVFDLVTDFSKYERWNTLIPHAKGNLEVGNKIDMILKLGGKSRPFSPTVISVEKNLSFTLSKTILLKQLGELHHKFEFIPHKDGMTELRQVWTGNGVFVKLFWPQIKRGFSEFEIFNENLFNHIKNQNI